MDAAMKYSPTRPLLRTVLSISLILGSTSWVDAHTHGSHEHAQGEAVPIKRSIMDLKIPNVILVRQDGSKTDLRTELDDPHPAYLNFIFTSCQTVCPVMTQTFAVLQEKLSKERVDVRMLSVSIDPEYDTPARLTAYAHQFGARDQWRFYTGTTASSTAVQKAFGVLGRDKMNHPVASFFRRAPGEPWVRIDGFASPEQLEAEYHASVGK
jgi:protein SCO1/2